MANIEKLEQRLKQYEAMKNDISKGEERAKQLEDSLNTSKHNLIGIEDEMKRVVGEELAKRKKDLELIETELKEGHIPTAYSLLIQTYSGQENMQTANAPMPTIDAKVEKILPNTRAIISDMLEGNIWEWLKSNLNKRVSANNLWDNIITPKTIYLAAALKQLNPRRFDAEIKIDYQPLIDGVDDIDYLGKLLVISSLNHLEVKGDKIKMNDRDWKDLQKNLTTNSKYLADRIYIAHFLNQYLLGYQTDANKMSHLFPITNEINDKINKVFSGNFNEIDPIEYGIDASQAQQIGIPVSVDEKDWNSIAKELVPWTNNIMDYFHYDLYLANALVNLQKLEIK